MKNSKKTKKLLAAFSCLAMIANVETTQNNRINAMETKQQEPSGGKEDEKENNPLDNQPKTDDKNEENQPPSAPGGGPQGGTNIQQPIIKEKENKGGNSLQNPTGNNEKDIEIIDTNKNKEDLGGNQPQIINDGQNLPTENDNQQKKGQGDNAKTNVLKDLVQLAKLWEKGEEISQKLPDCFKTQVIYMGNKNDEKEKEIQDRLRLGNLLQCEIVPNNSRDIQKENWNDDNLKDTNIVLFLGDVAKVMGTKAFLDTVLTNTNTWKIKTDEGLLVINSDRLRSMLIQYNSNENEKIKGEQGPKTQTKPALSPEIKETMKRYGEKTDLTKIPDESADALQTQTLIIESIERKMNERSRRIKRNLLVAGAVAGGLMLLGGGGMFAAKHLGITLNTDKAKDLKLTGKKKQRRIATTKPSDNVHEERKRQREI